MVSILSISVPTSHLCHNLWIASKTSFSLAGLRNVKARNSYCVPFRIFVRSFHKHASSSLAKVACEVVFRNLSRNTIGKTLSLPATYPTKTCLATLPPPMSSVLLPPAVKQCSPSPLTLPPPPNPPLPPLTPP